MHGRPSDAGPDCAARLCRCGAMSTERADCVICEQCCCPSCAHPLPRGGWVCESHLDAMVDAVVEMIEADSLVCDQKTSQDMSLLAQAGCTLPEATAHMRVIDRRIN